MEHTNLSPELEERVQRLWDHRPELRPHIERLRNDPAGKAKLQEFYEDLKRFERGQVRDDLAEELGIPKDEVLARFRHYVRDRKAREH